MIDDKRVSFSLSKKMFISVIRNLVSRRKKLVIVLMVAALSLQTFRGLPTIGFKSTVRLNCSCYTEQRHGIVTNNTKATDMKAKIINDYKINNGGVKNISDKTNIKRDEKRTPIPSRYVDFQLVLPFIEPNLDLQQRKLYVAVVVNSAAKGEKHRTLRQAIRETWGNAARSPTGNTTLMTHSWKVFFSLGIADNPTEHEANLKEASEHNDVIIGNFTDTYRNVVIKTFMAHFWAVTKLSCNYVLKTDDDVYVRVPGLISWLIKSGSPKQFYGGMVAVNYRIIRDPSSELYISEEQYPGIYWPLWCHGSYHVLSSDIIPSYIVYTYKRKPFPTDDAYLGVASLDLGIKVIQIPGFTIEDANPRKFRSDKEMNQSLAIGHKISPDQMAAFHEYYKRFDLT